MEAGPQSFAKRVIVGKDGTGIMEFVGDRNELHSGWRLLQVGDVGFFTLPPWWFGGHLSVSAAIDNGHYRVSETASDFLTGGGTALIFDGIV